MKKRILTGKLALMLNMFIVLVLVTACASGKSANTTPAASTEAGATKSTSAEPLKKVKIQLKWVPQAQFAGIYAAKEKGFYKDEGIDVEIVPAVRMSLSSSK